MNWIKFGNVFFQKNEVIGVDYNKLTKPNQKSSIQIFLRGGGVIKIEGNDISAEVWQNLLDVFEIED